MKQILTDQYWGHFIWRRIGCLIVGPWYYERREGKIRSHWILRSRICSIIKMPFLCTVTVYYEEVKQTPREVPYESHWQSSHCNGCRIRHWAGNRTRPDTAGCTRHVSRYRYRTWAWTGRRAIRR